MEFEPRIWIDNELTEWLNAQGDSVVNHGYDDERKIYVANFEDEETAIQFKLTFPPE